ncbi:group 1 glycosyl transferase [Thermincola ferriacetica]|uniref:Group 1 glycosyl transferase n=1 Tax=Thermincola ferriacetica TaxID=281456 RepID=A0A0L6W328_9FIRM|nr:glycosyltransferase family 4 protein [Thermincola ferriacetica]KNZ69972.1 group 1 glycosyl transferase [Thermincola ferriacetica]
MRIAQLHWAFPPIIGGVESHLAMLGPALINSSCQVCLLTGSVPGGKDEEWYEGMYIKRTPLMDLNSLSPEKISRQRHEIRQEIEGFIDRVQPDIIHAHNMHYFSPEHADILYEIKQERGIPLVLTAHNVWADEDKTWQEMNKRAHYWDTVIAVSDYIKRELTRVGYDSSKITTVHHGIDLARFKPVTEEDLEKIKEIYPEFEGRRVIFHPARMSLDKGCHISVEALNIIRKEFPNVLLVLAGTGKTVDWGAHQQRHVQKIMNQVEELGLGNNVFIRFFAWDDMPLVYKAAEFCVYPSCFEEPFGLVMLESMASEKPIVVSRAGGMPEVIQSRVNGFVVEMANAKELADRCCELLRNPGLCRQMGKQGRRMVEERWTKEIMTRATLEIYKKAVRTYTGESVKNTRTA